MMMRSTHLSDDRLLEVCLHDGPASSEEQHLSECAACEARRARLTCLLTEVSDVVAAEADAHFTPDRLARQRARVLERIEHEARHGRVIAFPAGHGPAAPLRARPGMRWVAGAAAAGLVIGLLAGHLAHDVPRRAPQSPSIASAGEPMRPALQFAAGPLSDEEFLGRIETAIEGTAGAALQPLDDLTPRVWEAAAQ